MKWPKLALFPRKTFISLLLTLMITLSWGGWYAQHLAFDMLFMRKFSRKTFVTYRRAAGQTGKQGFPEYLLFLQWMLTQPSELWSIRSNDYLSLHGYFFPAESYPDSTCVAILAHGYRGSPLQLANFVKFYHSIGFHVLLPMARGHSCSDGDVVTFGIKDSVDYHKWINEVNQQFGEEVSILLHGISMGAGTVLLTASNAPSASVKAVIADSSFSNLHEIFLKESSRILPSKFIAQLLLESYSERLRRIGDINFKAVDLEKTIASITLPVLFIHGVEDRFVPCEMSERLYRSVRHEKKYLFLVPNAGHTTSCFVAFETYNDHLTQFIRHNVQNLPTLSKRAMGEKEN